MEKHRFSPRVEILSSNSWISPSQKKVMSHDFVDFCVIKVMTQIWKNYSTENLNRHSNIDWCPKTSILKFLFGNPIMYRRFVLFLVNCDYFYHHRAKKFSKCNFYNQVSIADFIDQKWSVSNRTKTTQPQTHFLLQQSGFLFIVIQVNTSDFNLQWVEGYIEHLFMYCSQNLIFSY